MAKYVDEKQCKPAALGCRSQKERMMWIKSALPLAILLVSPITYGGEIYKWTDDKGQVHYDNTLSKSQKNTAEKVELKDVSIMPSRRQEGEVRYSRDKALPSQANRPGSTAAPDTPQASRDSAANDKKSRCEEEWKRYRESLDCVAPYRTATGGMKEEVTEHCTIMNQPDLCN